MFAKVIIKISDLLFLRHGELLLLMFVQLTYFSVCQSDTLTQLLACDFL